MNDVRQLDDLDIVLRFLLEGGELFCQILCDR